jgi:hypothetical protein
MIISDRILRETGAEDSVTEDFCTRFPSGMPITPDVCEENASLCEWDMLADYLLTATEYAEYWRRRSIALAEYESAGNKAFDRLRATGTSLYRPASGGNQHWNAFQQTERELSATYYRACARAFAEIYVAGKI